MKILTVQTFLAMLLGSMVYAHDLNGQGILQKEVTLQMEAVTLKKALIEIEQAAGVKFTYSPSVIAEDASVSVNASNKRLESVLHELLAPLDISFKEISGRISLYKAPPVGDERGSSDGSGNVSSDPAAFTVSGTVQDETGATLPGVNVIEKNTTNGTTTDVDGKYSLQVESEQSILVFSFIGYATQEIEVNGRTTIDVGMVQDMQHLDEVVVVGYGTKRR